MAVEAAEPTSRGASALSLRAADLTLLGRAALLHIALTVGVAALLMFRPGSDAPMVALYLLPTMFIDGVVWLLARRGRVRLGAWVMVANILVPALAAPPYVGGLHGHTQMSLAVAVLLAGVLLGWRPAVAVAAGASLATLGYALAQDAGLLTPRMVMTGLDSFGAVTGALVMCSLLLSQTVRALREALAQAQQREAERDEATRRFLTTQKMELVGRMASGIAHDFNNLLAVIRGGTEYLELIRPDDEELVGTLKDVDAATERAALLTRQLLALGRARLDEGTVPLDLTAVVVAQGRLIPRLLGSRIAVVCEAPTRLWVAATPAGLEQILLNLAVNARDAMPEGGTLSLSLREDAGQARLEVRDTGVGFTEEVRARMFEPFFTTRATGTGLGLATVHELVLRFGGSVSVESAPGRGACFTVRLPLVAAPPLEATSDVVPAPVPRRLRLLLVEDHAMARRELSRLLGAAGLEVTAVVDGEEALALLAVAGDIDAVLTDLSMPRLGGEALAHAMRARGLETPVVFFSGNGPPVAQVSRSAFLRKPVKRVDLLAALESLLNRHRDVDD